MGKPIIGITPSWDAEKERVYIDNAYPAAVTAAGALPLLLPLSDDKASIAQAAQLLDGVLFSGGDDIDPSLYGQRKTAQCGSLCPRRDAMEQALYQEAVEKLQKPALGICRGMQFLNVALGGTLHQDIPTQMNTSINHRQEKPYDRTVHRVSLKAATPLADLLSKTSIEVNSIHHQGVDVLTPRLVAMADAPDGLIEAFYLPGEQFLWGVQWHPEMIGTDDASKKIFEAFITASRQA